MSRTLYLFLLLLLATIPAVMQAQHKQVNTSPAPTWLVPWQPDLQKKPNAKSISDGYYLLLAEEQRQLELKSTYHHYIRQIVSEAGIQNGSEISVDYDPQYEKLSFHNIIIRRDGKEINRLQQASFKVLQQEQELSRFIYSGTYTAYFILEDVRKGDQIEYSYSITGSNPIFENKADIRYYLVAFEPIVNFYKNIIAAPSRKLHFKTFNNATMPQQRNWNGLAVYEWNNIELKEGDNNNNVPSWYNPFARVQASEYNSWGEVARWGQYVNTTSPPGPAVLHKIAALKKSAGNNPELYLRQALRFVQDDIRYMGIEMGEYSHRPNTPDRVITQRFGDCKDKALLLCTLLNANGISASMAYVNTDLKGAVNNMLPTPAAFNHAIVYASLGGKTYWLDATMSFQRGLPASFCEPDYQQALVITDTTTQLTPIIKKSQGRIVIRETLTLPDDENKDGALLVNTAWYREEADAQRAEMASASMKDKEKTFLNFYKKLYGEIIIRDSISLQDAPDSNIIRINESYVIHNLWKKDSSSGKLLFTTTAQAQTDMLPYISDEKRKVPVSIRYPYDQDYKIIINTPIEWSLDQEPVHIKNEYYQFDYTTQKEGKQIILSYQLKTFQDHIPVAFIPQYISDVRDIQRTASLDLTLKPAFMQAPARPSVPGNWLVIVLALLSAAVFTHLAMLYYKHSVLPVQHPLEPLPIGGWLSLLALGMVFTPMAEFAQICKSEVFNYDTWVAVSNRKDLGNITLVQLYLLGEVIGSVFLLVYSILLAVLFFNKRDTFPFALATFYFICTIYLFADNALYKYYFKVSAPDSLLWGTNSILWPLLRMAIWTPYLLRSQRAKATFIMPHPAFR